MSRDEPSWLLISCVACGRSWYGIERAHCASCHRTFGAAELFDRHRQAGHCVNPVGLSMVRRAKSDIWEARAEPTGRKGPRR